MGLLAWVIMGLALWHYTIFLPDRFWGGIVGAFIGSIVGAIITGLIIYAASSGSLAIPGRHATHLVTVLYAIPGAFIGIAVIYALGVAREHAHERASG
jgi:ABC-type Fe3+ transport system permease subunit